MNLFVQNDMLHHAYCIVGDADAILAELETFFTDELAFTIAGNPDFWHGNFDTFSIDDAHALKALHYSRPVIGDRKLLVVSTNFITEKAQNAMLKLFEEPVGGTHFFLLMPSADTLLPTLRSRLFIIAPDTETHVETFAKKFLALASGARMEAIKKFMDETAEEERSKIRTVQLLNALETELKKQSSVTQNAAMFEELEKVRQYAQDPSPSLKMLLEHIALSLPVLK